MIDLRLYEEFRDIGRDIFVSGLTSSHGGNMSVRAGDKIIIKRRGAQLGRLKPEDFVETSFRGMDSGITRASTELIVHRAIYQNTSALAVIHAHPRTAIVLSLSRDEIIHIDNVAASRVISRVIQTFQLELSVKALFDAPTVAEMAGIITQNQTKRASDAELAQMVREIEGIREEEAQRDADVIILTVPKL